MVDNETIESKVEDAKEKIDEKINANKEKGKNFADNVINDLYKSVDELKENIKSVQKAVDEKYFIQTSNCSKLRY